MPYLRGVLGSFGCSQREPQFAAVTPGTLPVFPVVLVVSASRKHDWFEVGEHWSFDAEGYVVRLPLGRCEIHHSAVLSGDSVAAMTEDF